MRSATVALVSSRDARQTVPAADTQGAPTWNSSRHTSEPCALPPSQQSDQDLRPVAERYVSEDYVEHTYPMDRPGREGTSNDAERPRQGAIPGLVQCAAPAAGVRSLDAVLSLKERYMSDGEYVIWVTELPSADSKGKPTMSFNMVHIINGKVTNIGPPARC